MGDSGVYVEVNKSRLRAPTAKKTGGLPSEQRDVFTSNAGSVAIAATSRYSAESTTASSLPFPSAPPSPPPSPPAPPPASVHSDFIELTRDISNWLKGHS